MGTSKHYQFLSHNGKRVAVRLWICLFLLFLIISMAFNLCHYQTILLSSDVRCFSHNPQLQKHQKLGIILFPQKCLKKLAVDSEPVLCSSLIIQDQNQQCHLLLLKLTSHTVLTLENQHFCFLALVLRIPPETPNSFWKIQPQDLTETLLRTL